MKRWIFAVLSALSLLLCVAVCVLWVRSYRTRDIVARGVCGRHFQVTSARGGLWFSVDDSDLRPAH